MKLSLHISKDHLKNLFKLCVTVVDVSQILKVTELFDYIYFGGFMFKKDPFILYSFDLKDVDLDVILVRQGFLSLCCVNSCGCSLGCDIDKIKDFMFSRKYSIRNNEIVLVPEKESGFGRYVREIVFDVVDKEKGEVHLHGCESETVIFQIERYGFIKYKMYGIPRYNELDEMPLSSDSMISLVNNKYAYIVKDNDQIIIPDYEHMSYQESYNEYFGYYPKLNDVDSLKFCFKYSTYLGFEIAFLKLFKDDGVTIIDVGSWVLGTFLDGSGIKCVVPYEEDTSYVYNDEIKHIKRGSIVTNVLCDPLWESVVDINSYLNDMVIKLRGYVNKFILLPKNYIGVDSRLKLIVKGRTLCLFQLMIFKSIISVEEFSYRQFRSNLTREHVIYKDMFDDRSSALKVALFSYCNLHNLYRFRENAKKGKLLEGNYLVLVLSAESYKYRNGKIGLSKRPVIKENGFEDFAIYNTEIMFCDYMSVNDFYCLTSMKKSFKGELNFDVTDDRCFYWGIASNIFTYNSQKSFNSATIVNKSISTKLKEDFGFDEDQLHRMRFAGLIKLFKEYSDLKYHDEGMWSLAYYIKDGKRFFVDVSGHMLNLTVLNTISIVNFCGYLRQKNLNIMRAKSGNIKENLDQYVNDVGYNDVENRGLENDLWHTNSEDTKGIVIAAGIINESSLPFTDTVRIESYFREKLVDTRGMISITVKHDKISFGDDL